MVASDCKSVVGDTHRIVHMAFNVIHLLCRAAKARKIKCVYLLFSFYCQDSPALAQLYLSRRFAMSQTASQSAGLCGFDSTCKSLHNDPSFNETDGSNFNIQIKLKERFISATIPSLFSRTNSLRK